MRMNDTLRVSSASKIDNVKVVQQEEMGRVVDTDYDTLWSCLFVMDPVVKNSKETWLV